MAKYCFGTGCRLIAVGLWLMEFGVILIGNKLFGHF